MSVRSDSESYNIHKIILRSGAGKLCQTQQSQDQSHTDIDTELCLFEIGGSGIVIDLNGDLIDSGKGMQHQHVGLRQFHFFRGQYIEIFQADIILFVEETFLLHTGHV